MAEISYREALRDALIEEMDQDPDVFVMGEEVGVFQGAYKVTEGLLDRFGEKRVIDTPIAEEGFVGLGAGAAMTGLRPVVELMTINFGMVAMDQIANHAAKISYMFGGRLKCPMVIRAPGGGGQQLTAQHSHSLDVWFAYIPGLKVVAPAVPADAKGLLKTAIRDDNPVMFLEHLALYNSKGVVPEGEHTVPFGEADVKRVGSDVTLIAHSRMVLFALQAAAQLSEEGISVEVIDLRSIRPFDVETLVHSVQKTNHCVIAEEEHRSFGVNAEVAATIYEEAFDHLDAPIARVGGVEVPMPYSKPLEQAVIPSPEKIVDAVRTTLNA
ncbi:MAG: pyruvate dehydrogenase complex E1 component subunit beta [Chloroflexi bacterium]|nr:pyruvate dehydrogenase complex E1 component subunit beta [Chloroflexota bacterium]